MGMGYKTFRFEATKDSAQRPSAPKKDTEHVRRETTSRGREEKGTLFIKGKEDALGSSMALCEA